MQEEVENTKPDWFENPNVEIDYSKVTIFGSHNCKVKETIKLPIEQEYSVAMVYPEKK